MPETFIQMSNEVFMPHYLWSVVVDTTGLLSRLPSTVSNSSLASCCRWAVGCPVCYQSEKWGEQSNNRSSQILLAVSPLVNCLLPNQLSSVTRSCLTLCDPMNARPPYPSPTHGIHPNPCPVCWWCHPAISSSVVPFSSCPQSFPASESLLMSQLFTSGGYWSFSFNISPSNEYSGLISFRMDWLDLLAVQGTLKSLLQHHSSKASILLCSAFFIVQLSHSYMTTGKTTALTRRTFIGKVVSLLFNMLSRLVITFLPRSTRLWISWLQSPSYTITTAQHLSHNSKETTFSTAFLCFLHVILQWIILSN